MRSDRSLLLLGLVLILLFVNVQIFRYERAITRGETIILKLLPQDPRSLMQGDYMRLRYELATNFEPQPEGGLIYLKPDAQGVADKPVPKETPGAVPLRYRVLGGRVFFDIETYFFQEGMASRYERARYVELRVDSRGVPHILRLLGENREEL